MTSRILVTGSRTWTDPHIIFGALVDAWNDIGAPDDVVLVTGAARGADQLAETVWTTDLHRPVERHPADWTRLGKRAGLVRNGHMVTLGADICLAFIRDNSRGATSCAAMAERAGIPVRRYFM
jgi:YspA, cpYpsA-related SLOG family